MKLFTFATIVFLSLLSCTDFMSQYERIEENRIRLIDFIYEPAEAAPGDTVLCKTIFAGKEIGVDDIEWRVSYKLSMNAFGFDSAFDEQPLHTIAASCSTINASTQCFSMRFVIPKNCIAESPLVQDDWMSVLPPQLHTMLPPELKAFDKQAILSVVDSLAGVAASADADGKAALAAMLPESFSEQLPLLVQLLTTKIRLYAYVKNSHRIRSDYTVGYNRTFSKLPDVPLYENRNPSIDSIGLYRVKGVGIADYDKNADTTEYFSLTADGDTGIEIPVKEGYTYFVEAFVNNRDSVVTLGDMLNDEPVSVEDLSAEWLFQMDENEMENVKANDRMNIASLGDLNGMFYPPQSRKIKQFTIWVQVTDSKVNVLHRSQGSMVRAIKGRFVWEE